MMKLGIPVFGQFLPFLFAEPLKDPSSWMGNVSTQPFLNLSRDLMFNQVQLWTLDPRTFTEWSLFYFLPNHNHTCINTCSHCIKDGRCGQVGRSHRACAKWHESMKTAKLQQSNRMGKPDRSQGDWPWKCLLNWCWI